MMTVPALELVGSGSDVADRLGGITMTMAAWVTIADDAGDSR